VECGCTRVDRVGITYSFYTITVHDLANDQLKVRNNSMGAIAQDNF
jgi:hypothetical protein